jgi:DNA modification methylase
MKLSLEYLNPKSLIPDPNNPRRHNRKQRRKLQKIIRKNGFSSPILVDENLKIICGHLRHEAALEEELSSIPVIVIRGLTEAQKVSLALTDNRIPEDAEWDLERLAKQFEAILEFDPCIDLTDLGFKAPEINLAFESLSEQSDLDDPKADLVPERPKVIVTREGDLWILGDHRLCCGDAIDKDAMAALAIGLRIILTITYPPFNVKIDGHVSGKGRVKHREFLMASGEMTRDTYQAFLAEAFDQIAMVSCDGAIVFVFIDWRHLGEVLAAGEEVFDEFKNLIVRAKTNAGMGTFYRSQHELIPVFKVGHGAHINNFELGQYGRHRSNVWTYPGANSFHADRDKELSLHPTVKPVAMIADAIRDCSRRGDNVLDPFAGSGTILIAAEKTGRRALAMELDPGYVDVAIRRWQDYTGKEAVHEATGLTFDELAKQRDEADASESEAQNAEVLS